MTSKKLSERIVIALRKGEDFSDGWLFDAIHDLEAELKRVTALAIDTGAALDRAAKQRDAYFEAYQTMIDCAEDRYKVMQQLTAERDDARLGALEEVRDIWMLTADAEFGDTLSRMIRKAEDATKVGKL